MIFRAKAPLRISFCGGGTDVSPYPEERGGVVLSATIDKYAFASLRPRDDGTINVTSLDYDLTRSYPVGEALVPDGELDLVKGVLNRFQQQVARAALPTGCDIFIHSDAPPGSGLGSSSTMVTALCGVVAEWLRIPLTPYDIAELTYQVERVDLGIAGGRQDQYAATFGGFNFMEFHRDHTVVNPLRLRRHTQNELEYSLQLCFTGATRLSAHIVENQTASYRAGRADVVAALDHMKELTLQMKALLLRDRVAEFGNMLDVAWRWKKQLDASITNSGIDALYQSARDQGALGGKLLGAGGGGFLLVLSPFTRKHHVGRALERAGGRLVPFAFEHSGLQTWTAPE